MPDDNDLPAKRDSGSLAIFDAAAREALTSLEAFGLDEAGEELAHEARNLVTIFDGWKLHVPSGEDRAIAITRVLDLQRKVGEYLVRRRDDCRKLDEGSASCPPPTKEPSSNDPHT